MWGRWGVQVQATGRRAWGGGHRIIRCVPMSKVKTVEKEIKRRRRIEKRKGGDKNTYDMI
jgi:hypothetical protein